MSIPADWLTDRGIVAARPPKNAVDPWRPYACFCEPERSATGEIVSIATVLLTNRECPFKCLYCDLWKNTLDERVPLGAIPAQIDWALQQLPPARQIKLYNSGNFFDAQAIPPEDHAAIADRVRGFERVIVENHPRLCGAAVGEFQQRLGTQLEIALGLETAHPDVLPKLNKRMTLDDYAHAVTTLLRQQIDVRTFLLIRPPFLSDSEGLDWACRSLEFAWSCGVETCCLIPVRGGNGMLDQLSEAGEFAPPSLASVEQAFAFGLGRGQGRVFLDTWDLDRLAPCARCWPAQKSRYERMNLSQEYEAPVVCHCESPS